MLSWNLLYFSILLSKGLVSGSFIPWDRQTPATLLSKEKFPGLLIPWDGKTAAGTVPSTCRTPKKPRLSRTAPVGDFYAPTSQFKTYAEGLHVPSAFIQSSLQATALIIVQDMLGLRDGDVAYTSGYSTDVADYAYVAQSHQGIPFVNAVANFVLKDGKIVAFGSSFVDLDKVHVAPSNPRVHVNEAIRAAEISFNGYYNQQPTKLEYYVSAAGSVALVHSIQVQNDKTNTWVEAYVDAHTCSLLGSTNFVAQAGYHAVLVGKSGYKGDGYALISDPQDLKASPLGWHKTQPSSPDNPATSGNNAMAYIGQPQVSGPSSPSPLLFDYKYDVSLDPDQGPNPNAARTNAFYVVNRIHDIAYRYGFTEDRFNFQFNNFGKGGADGDYVKVVVHSGEQWDNAQFVTPPDGQSGVLTVYSWCSMKDGALDNTILVHEMVHGISGRLTGGGTGKCYQRYESLGLGEGWSDVVADWMEQITGVTEDFWFARHAIDNAKGWRSHPYSTDISKNPLKYSDLTNAMDTYNVHAAGEVWANMLHNAYDALVKKHGYSPNAKQDPNGTEGNIIFMHLVIETLSAVSCNPSYIQARDAFINAYKVKFKGDECVLWPSFAQRGLGLSAIERQPGHGYVDAVDKPKGC